MRPVTPSRSARRAAGALGLALALASPGFAADGDAEDKLDEVVEGAAEAETEDGEAAGADVGEASYNVENCEPANDAEGGAEGDAEGGEAMADASEVDPKDLDPCRDMDK